MADEPKPLDLLVMNHKAVMYEGEVENITSFNTQGEFDILSYHANFISLIKDRLVIREMGGKKIEFPIKQGIMRVHKNQVRVFLDVETEGEEMRSQGVLGSVG